MKTVFLLPIKSIASPSLIIRNSTPNRFFLNYTLDTITASAKLNYSFMTIKKPKTIRLVVLGTIFLIALSILFVLSTNNHYALSASLINSLTSPKIPSTTIIIKEKKDRKTLNTQKETLKQALEDNNIKLNQYDKISPNLNANIQNYRLFFVKINRRYAVTIKDNNKEKKIVTKYTKISNILKDKKIKLNKEDKISPKIDTTINNNDTIAITRANTVIISVDGQTRVIKTFDKKISSILKTTGISLDKDDYSIPNKDQKIDNTNKIDVIRVAIKKETTKENIAFETISQKSDELYENEEKITQAGANGILEKSFEIKLENNQEISRKLISKKTSLKPQNKIIVYGTKKRPTGKIISDGQATYYYGPTIAACNLFPAGTKIKVTNVNNGKSIEVIIDDTGGFGWPTVIDLRDDYFQKIAGPGDDGIMSVTLEEIL